MEQATSRGKPMIALVVVMPETDLAVATPMAERLRRRIASEPFSVQQSNPQKVDAAEPRSTLTL